MNCFVVFILFLYLFSLEMFRHFFAPAAPMSYATPVSIDRLIDKIKGRSRSEKPL